TSSARPRTSRAARSGSSSARGRDAASRPCRAAQSPPAGRRVQGKLTAVAKGNAEGYRPAEACRIAEVAPYLLRCWETEFPALSEGKDKGAAKLYTARDVKIISRIRELLYDEGFTVAGAKKRLEAEIAEGRFDDGLAPAPPLAQQKS